MKKFLVVLTLLSAYVQSYGYDICNDPDLKAVIEEENSEPPLKLNDHTMFVATSCVNNTIEYIYVASDKLFKFLKKNSEADLKSEVCSESSTKIALPKIGTGKLIRTYINKSLTEKLRISVTEKECKELLPDF
ncbi:hypothetical protein KDE12_05745 [Campylobacter sp. faydin G-105]|uniref:hypothetical protein n=1 Tax=Campylobacter anatolicus TaxID=2829105 RepID=UPI001B932C00|nr:hypothetical protein [Campylobacter anatolicus]MBR8462356.1 hypothetical protein [Campylobacter anatolicus]